MLIQDNRLKACPESIEGEKDKSFGDDKSPTIIYEAAEAARWQDKNYKLKIKN